MSGLVGNPAKLRDLATSLKRLPVRLAQDVAAKVPPEVTGRAQASYASGATVYGEARPLGVNGNALSLVKSGATQGQVRFVAIGTLVRARLGTRYAKFLIGKYSILPNGPMPAGWSKAIGEIARSEIARALP